MPSRLLSPARVLGALVILGAHAGLLPGQRPQPTPPQTAPDPSAYAALRYRHIGPEGNRVSAVTGVPGDPHTYYVGAASGGIWKTTDGGLTWAPIFDDQPVHSIGSLAVAPSDPNIVWAGTGEPHVRSHISVGWGIYKSTDAGKTWAKMGLDATGRIARVIVHPTNPDIVYAASQGHLYGPQQEKGVYRTIDGGKTWERVLFVDENTGISDMVMNPVNPRILYAGAWTMEIHTWGRESGGPASGLFTTRDGGTTWKRLSGNGLPTGPVGKIGLGISRSNPNRVYALIETSDGVPFRGQPGQLGRLWRTDDGGETWRMVNSDRQVAGRTHYYNRMAVSTDDEDEAYFLTAAYSKTLDGGRSLVDIGFGQAPGGDHHDMWIDPTDADRMVVGHDGGVSISTNRGKSWLRQQLPIAQMYHVTVDNRVPYWVYGNQQDGPSHRGPSNSKLGGFGGFGGNIPRGMWHSVGGGESGWATPHPTDSNLVWSSASGSGSRGGIVVLNDLRTGNTRNVEVWPVSTGGWPAADLRYRFVWTAPLTISPHDPNKLYIGSQHVHVTTDFGQSWQVISPDLTLNDKSRQQISGGLTPDNIGVEYFNVVFAITESPVQRDLLWAGTNDGLVHLSRDGGKTWTNVTANLPGLPPLGTVSNIEASRWDAGTAYLTVDGHQVNNRDPWVYKTADYGRTWKLIVNGVPKSPLSYAHVIREDPKRRGLLYLGTENALYVSFDDGERWQPLQTNLPASPVYWLTVQEHFNDLVVATYGRGFWILDDITPLQQATPEVLAADAHLFAPRPTYRLRQVESPAAPSNDPTVGQNPPYGASLNYWLKSAPSADPAITISDPTGRVVRTLTGTKSAGVNRVWWDLRFEPSKEARIRVSPLYAPDVAVPKDGMPAPGIGRVAILAPPGTYTVKLSVGGRDFSQQLEVRKDPNSGGSLQGIQEQTALVSEIKTTLDGAVDMVNAIELVRLQLQGLDQVLAREEANKDLRAGVDSVGQELLAIEEELHQVRLTNRGQDGVRWPIKLAGQLSYLAGTITSADFGPTTQAREAYRYLEEKVRAVRVRYDRAMGQLLPALNARLRARNVANVIAASP
jgi:photosystem II stability/assembly factor-like uncharacterized protein